MLKTSQRIFGFPLSVHKVSYSKNILKVCECPAATVNEEEEKNSCHIMRAACLSICSEYLEVVELGAGEEALAGTWAGVTWSAGLQMERQHFVSISQPR